MTPEAAEVTAAAAMTGNNLLPVNGVVPLSWYLTLSALLFVIGAVGVLVKRNPIVIFMCVELMLNAVNLSFIAFGRYLGDSGGMMFSIFVMAVAAAEVAVGLGILISIFRSRENINVDEVNVLRG
ncbi:MAG: NADH-quinone oxidoreductase subunit NuoK [Armatimonadaceae bacterium]